MTHKGTMRLETDRLILRRFVETDIEDIFNNWSNDPEVTKFLRWQPHGDISVTRGFMEDKLLAYEKPDYYLWAMELKATGQVIGTIGVGRHNDGPRSATMGYAMGRAWWNMGYMSEALGRVVRFLFEEVGMNRVEAQHDTRNPGSGRVMQKAGMTYEGTLRQSGMNNQGVCDEAYWAILASEYKQGL